MEFNVWRFDAGDKTDVLWDGPLSQEDAEKVRFCRQRDADADYEHTSWTFVVRPIDWRPEEER